MDKNISLDQQVGVRILNYIYAYTAPTNIIVETPSVICLYSAVTLRCRHSNDPTGVVESDHQMHQQLRHVVKD